MLCVSKIKSGILGLAIGDAVGVPVEFKSRESLKASPIADMTGYGAYNLPAAFYIKATGHDRSKIACNMYISCAMALMDGPSMADLRYGLDGIPEEWKNTLVKRDYIEKLCEKFYGGLI